MTEEHFSIDILNNIKHERPVDFVLILPSPPAPPENLRIPKTTKSKVASSTFRCDLCPFDCLLKRQIISHVSRHVQLGKFPYHGCGRIIRSKQGAKIHWSETYSCQICGDDFVCIASLNKHVKAAHSQKVFTCETCNKSYKWKHGLKRHEMYNQHGSHKADPATKFFCNQCPYVGKSKYNLNSHKQVHNKQFECKNCKERYYDKYRMERHEIKCIDQPFPCQHCSKLFRTKNSRYIHKSKYHSEQRFECDHCSEMFNNKNNLRNHILNHFKILCKECGKSVNRIDLKIHYEDEHGTKKLECDLCSSKFKRKLLLSGHFTRMHPKGNYACVLCRGGKFEKINDLLQHQRIHIGRRQWKCLKCKFETESKYKLKRHHAKKHKMHRLFLKKGKDW